MIQKSGNLLLFLVLNTMGCTEDNSTLTVQAPIQQPPAPSSSVTVAGGTIAMGGDGATDGKPIHSVTVGSFIIEKYEISFDAWTTVREWGLTHGYTDLPAAQHGYRPVGTGNPAARMSWYDVVKWCNARSEKESMTPVFYTDSTQTRVYRTGDYNLPTAAVLWTANGYRLPTEAEWEFAARGGTKSHNCSYSGSNNIDSVAWYSSNSEFSTHPIASKFPNELGLYDMSGNAAEWCWDVYAPYSSNAQTDPKGGEGGNIRVVRGGSWMSGVSSCRPPYRESSLASVRADNIGCRLVRSK